MNDQAPDENEKDAGPALTDLYEKTGRHPEKISEKGIETDTWQALADISFNARLRDAIELLMRTPADKTADRPDLQTSHALPQPDGEAHDER